MTCTFSTEWRIGTLAHVLSPARRKRLQKYLYVLGRIECLTSVKDSVSLPALAEPQF